MIAIYLVNKIYKKTEYENYLEIKLDLDKFITFNEN